MFCNRIVFIFAEEKEPEEEEEEMMAIDEVGGDDDTKVTAAVISMFVGYVKSTVLCVGLFTLPDIYTIAATVGKCVRNTLLMVLI